MIAKATIEELDPAARKDADTQRDDGDPQAEDGWTPPPPETREKDAAAIACSLENPETCEACQ